MNAPEHAGAKKTCGYCCISMWRAVHTKGLYATADPRLFEDATVNFGYTST